MPDQNASNHWDSLLSDIGATPASEDKLRQPEAKELPPAKPDKPATPRRNAPPKAVDWDSIAGDLGLQPPPKPKEPIAAKTEPEAVVETVKPTSVTPERGEESPNFFDERFDFEEPFDLLESNAANGEEEIVEDNTKPGEAENKEKRPRKRRRRRRPAKDSDARKDEPPADDDVIDFTHEPPSDKVTTEQTDAEDSEIGEAEKPQSDESGEKRRSKRRRPRRGKKRKSSDRAERDESPEESDDSEEVSEKRRDEQHGSDTVRPKKKNDGEDSVRAGFRGIPTWNEAVGMLIEKNLEGRSKRPEGGSQRGRGKKRR